MQLDLVALFYTYCINPRRLSDAEYLYLLVNKFSQDTCLNRIVGFPSLLVSIMPNSRVLLYMQTGKSKFKHEEFKSVQDI